MTRQQQNTLILDKIGEKLADTPTVNEVLEKSFTNWFRSLAVAGIQHMAATTAMEEQQEQEEQQPQNQQQQQQQNGGKQ